MSKDKISDYSQTANSNTDIGGINVDEGCAPSGINNAIRTLMKQLKDFQQGTNSDSFNGPTNGAHNGTVGATTPAAGTFTTLTASGNVVLGDASTDTLNVGNGGLVKDASGNLGLGVTPSAWASGRAAIEASGFGLQSFSAGLMLLHQNSFYNGTNYIYKTTAAASMFGQSGANFYWYQAPSGTAGNAITFTQAMTLDASGNLGVGTTSPQLARAHFTTATTYTLNLQNDASNQSGIIFSRNGNGAASSTAIVGNGEATGYLYFLTGGSERARIDSSGNLLVGKTTASASSGVGVESRPNGLIACVLSTSTNADTAYNLYSTGAGAYRFYVGMGGTIYATSTTITGISDQRLKRNIRDLDDGLDKVMALQPRKFDWKEGKGAGTKDARGFIAQEFETVFPDMIEEWRDPAPEGEEPYKAVNANLIPTLVKAIQEQQAIIESLKARLDAANM